jgi:hypothetical protein
MHSPCNLAHRANSRSFPWNQKITDTRHWERKPFVMWLSSHYKHWVFTSKCKNNWRQSNWSIHLSCAFVDSKTLLSFSSNLHYNRSEPVGIIQIFDDVIFHCAPRAFVFTCKNKWGEGSRIIHLWRAFHERANYDFSRHNDKIIEVNESVPVIFHVILIFVEAPSFLHQNERIIEVCQVDVFIFPIALIIVRTSCLSVEINKYLKNRTEMYSSFIWLQLLFELHVLEWIWENNWRQLESTMHLSSDFAHTAKSEYWRRNERITEKSRIEVFISVVSLIMLLIQSLCVGTKKSLKSASLNHSYTRWILFEYGLQVLTLK